MTSLSARKKSWAWYRMPCRVTSADPRKPFANGFQLTLLLVGLGDAQLIKNFGGVFAKSRRMASNFEFMRTKVDWTAHGSIPPFAGVFGTSKHSHSSQVSVID